MKLLGRDRAGRHGESSRWSLALWAPFISRFEGVFTYIQTVWGFITPGIVAAFLFGMVVKKAPACGGHRRDAHGRPDLRSACYGCSPTVAFLHHMAMTFLVQIAFMAAVTRAVRWRRRCRFRIPVAWIPPRCPARGCGEAW